VKKGVPVPVVWASGSNGVILRSLDEGKTWKAACTCRRDAPRLSRHRRVQRLHRLRYVQRRRRKIRIYKTTTAAKRGNRNTSDKRKEFFLDSIACLSETRCFALGDPSMANFSC